MSSGCLPSFRGVWMIRVILAVSGTLLEGRHMAPKRALSNVDLPVLSTRCQICALKASIATPESGLCVAGDTRICVYCRA